MLLQPADEGLGHAVHHLVDVVRAQDHVREHFVDAGQTHEKIPRGDARALDADLRHRDDPVEDFARELETAVPRLLVERDLGHLDLVDIALVLDLDVEVTRHHRAGGVGPSHIDLLGQTEPRVAERRPHRDEGGDDHVAGHMIPLIDLSPQPPFHGLGNTAFAFQRQLVIDVHFVPRHLEQPHHGSFGLEPVELRPQSPVLLLCVRRGDLGLALAQPAEYVPVMRRHHRSSSFQPCMERALRAAYTHAAHGSRHP